MKPALILLAASALALSGAIASRAAAPAHGVDEALIAGETLPETLGEFGFFLRADGTDPAPGVVAYDLNTPLYSDGADKLRYIYVPKGKRALAKGEGLISFPVGSAIIKTFAYGTGEAQRFLETRVLLHREAGWVALPYRWNAERTQARLALAGGRLAVTTPAGEQISYRIPNKNQCKTCHGKHGAVIPIGPKPRNLSPQWLETYAASGRLAGEWANAGLFPRWDEAHAADPKLAARAYLDVNCAHCHQPGGSASNSGLDLRFEQDDRHALGIGKPPVAAGRGSGGHLVSIVPGDPDRSILLHRMQSTEPGVAMPELGKETVDHDGVAVVRRWIAGMER